LGFCLCFLGGVRGWLSGGGCSWKRGVFFSFFLKNKAAWGNGYSNGGGKVFVCVWGGCLGVCFKGGSWVGGFFWVYVGLCFFFFFFFFFFFYPPSFFFFFVWQRPGIFKPLSLYEGDLSPSLSLFFFPFPADDVCGFEMTLFLAKTDYAISVGFLRKRPQAASAHKLHISSIFPPFFLTRSMTEGAVSRNKRADSSCGLFLSATRKEIYVRHSFPSFPLLRDYMNEVLKRSVHRRMLDSRLSFFRSERRLPKKHPRFFANTLQKSDILPFPLKKLEFSTLSWS